MIFFFSSRRRHTRLQGDWSSDVCSSDLIRVESIALVGPQWAPTVTARVTLRGVTRDLRFAAAVLRQDDTLVVVAGFRIRQSEFGIEPFTTFNGGLRVRDPLDIRVRLVARREK